MRIVGVVDLRGGLAVHARGGRRDRYRPVTCIAGLPIEPGDARAAARIYVEHLGLDELYVADLDAIRGRPHQSGAIAAVAGSGASVWLDAGVSSAEGARCALAAGATGVVVGLETLVSYRHLSDICVAIGGDRAAFSLDLRDGIPIVAGNGISADEAADAIAARAAAAGAGTVIVLDLARVGTNDGIDMTLIESVRTAVPGITLMAGGGIRGMDDMARLADAGCDGVLVATALHDGRLGAAQIAAVRRYTTKAAQTN